MAIARRARVVQSQRIGELGRWLELEPTEPLGFSGGQYVIINSGLVSPTGRAAKRAYSFISEDAIQERFQLVVKRIGAGLCSTFIHALTPGAEVEFSGPWGKFIPPDELDGPLLVLATDTGITAALGLLSSTRFQRHSSVTSLAWLRPGGGDFVSDEFVRERVASRCAELCIQTIVPPEHPERLAMARAAVAQLLDERRVAHALCCGDGVVNYGLMGDFAARGVNVARDQVESFFNMPRKSS